METSILFQEWRRKQPIPRQTYKAENISEFPLTPIGVLALGSAHARPSTRPLINKSGILLAHVSAKSPWNISPNPSEVISKVSEPYDNFWKSPPFVRQK